MSHSVTYSPLIQWKPALQGLLAGSLVAGGLLAPFGLAAQVILLLMGAFIFIDSLIPNGETSIMATVAFVIIGALLSALSAALNLAFLWLPLVVVITIVFYFLRFSGKKGKGKA